jgi:alpha-mannosidase
MPLPEPEKPIYATGEHGNRKHAVVDVPAFGFAWLPSPEQAAKSKRPPVLLAELPALLRNEFFEVYVNEATGGIARIKNYGRSPNRLSQQICYRFPRERIVPDPEGEGATRSYYSTMRCDGLETLSNGPGLAEVVSRGRIIDPQEGTVLAGFRQTVRVWTHLPCAACKTRHCARGRDRE